MEKIEKVSENQISDEIYEKRPGPKGKLLFIFLCLGVISFWANFPFSDKIKQIAADQLNSIPGCPIKYDNLDIEYFLPKIVLNNISIPSICLKKRGPNIQLDKLYLYFRGIRIFPLGIKLLAWTKLGESELNLYQSLSVNDQLLSIKNTVVRPEDLDSFLDLPIKMGGNLDLKIVTQLIKNKITKLSFHVKSSDLRSYPSDIMGIKLPAMDIGNFSLKGSMDSNKKLRLSELILGHSTSPIRAKVNGSIHVNSRFFNLSSLDLKSQIKFSKEFLEQFGIINLFLQSRKPDDQGFYKLDISGTVSDPKFK